jgi:hypothetical protein
VHGLADRLPHRRPDLLHRLTRNAPRPEHGRGASLPEDAMKKLKLALEQLEVASFETADEPDGAEPERLLLRTPLCSAIDACPTRLCDTSRC